MENKKKEQSIAPLLIGKHQHSIDKLATEIAQARELLQDLFESYNRCAQAHELREPLSIKELLNDPEILQNASFEKASSETLIGSFKPNKKMFLESIEMPPGFLEFIEAQKIARKIFNNKRNLLSASRFLTIGSSGIEANNEAIEANVEQFKFYASTEKQIEAHELATVASETYSKIIELQGGIFSHQSGTKFPMLLPTGEIDFAYISTLK